MHRNGKVTKSEEELPFSLRGTPCRMANRGPAWPFPRVMGDTIQDFSFRMTLEEMHPGIWYPKQKTEDDPPLNVQIYSLVISLFFHAYGTRSVVPRPQEILP